MVGAGGFLGAILRFAVSGYFQNGSTFPVGTLAVNVIGCFMIGVLAQLMESRMGLSHEVQLLLIVGFLGSFTTYATFSNETLQLLQNSRPILSLVNVCLQLVLGLSGVVLGRWVMLVII